jgi:hypothetical protein
MVELLLDSAEDSKLKETLIADDKNMWHIISDFKPFDRYRIITDEKK